MIIEEPLFFIKAFIEDVDVTLDEYKSGSRQTKRQKL
jgi:hypothetical protein